jgi:hypothetical protein
VVVQRELGELSSDTQAQIAEKLYNLLSQWSPIGETYIRTYATFKFLHYP